MAITLRVVGIFFSRSVELGPGGGTVQEVMDAAVAANTADDAFGYAPGSGAVTTMGMYTSKSFKSPTDELNMMYPAGYYIQSETANDLSANPYTVWQYYIFDENNEYLNRGKGAILSNDPRAQVPDKGSVVWRILSILRDDVQPSGKQLMRLGLPIVGS